MLVLLSFIFLVAIGIAILLVFNKSKEADDIKAVLKEMLINLKGLFINLKDLTVLLISLIQKSIQEESETKEVDEVRGPVQQTQETEIKTPQDISKKPSHEENKTEILNIENSQSEDIAQNETFEPKDEAPKKEEIPTDQGIVNGTIEIDSLTELNQQEVSSENESQEVVSEISNKDEDIAS